MGNKCCVGQRRDKPQSTLTNTGNMSVDGRYNRRGRYTDVQPDTEHIPAGCKEYGLPVSGYPEAWSEALYQPRYPVILMDPSCGTFEYDNKAFDLFMDVQLRQSDKETRHSRQSHHADHGKNRRKEGKRTTTQSAEMAEVPPTRNRAVVVQVRSPAPTTDISVGSNISSCLTSPLVSDSTTVRASADSADPQSRDTPTAPCNQSCDVMICYSHGDRDAMVRVKERLQAAGVSAWVDESVLNWGTHHQSKGGQAIIDAKVFLCILSEEFLRSRSCRHQVALAYLSDTAIFPVIVQSRQALLDLMDSGLKMLLACYKWTPLSDGDAADTNIMALASDIKTLLDSLTRKLAEPEMLEGGKGQSERKPDLQTSQGHPEQEQNAEDEKRAPVRAKRASPRLRHTNTAAEGDDYQQVKPEQFWNNRFGPTDSVDWPRFAEGFLEEFHVHITRLFAEKDNQQMLLDVVKRELHLGETTGRVYKDQLTNFCGTDGDKEGRTLWNHVEEKVRERFALREVFEVNSTVRVDAIRNVDRFCSPAVIHGLRDLLSDHDDSTRAVATVALARANADDDITVTHIMGVLADDDRLVREAACLALGRFKARLAVKKLTHLWRNDPTSNVRGAACTALSQIGGQEVEAVFRVTNDLETEIRLLAETTSLTKL